MTTLHVLRSGALPARDNMALDLALLHAGEGATLRLYGWRPHAISLGRFQDPARIAELVPAAHRPIELVQRATGGGAIWHADELTFALACPVEAMPGGTAVAIGTAALHDALVLALADCGIGARRLTPKDLGASCRARARPTRPWCFELPGPHDIVLPDGSIEHGRKLIGSAQRRIRQPVERLLAHGSIPLRRPPAPDTCGSIEDVATPDAAFVEHLEARLAFRIAELLGADRTEDVVEPSAAIRAAAASTEVRIESVTAP
jgi:lipoate-protein ligase A